MKARLTNKEDYKKLVDWWKFWRFPAPKMKMLPNEMEDGVMVYDDNTDLCAGFFYRTFSSFCWVEWIVVNPEIKDKNVREEAIKYTIHSIINLAEKMGFEAVFTSVKHQSLINKLAECGFQKADVATNMVYMISRDC